MPALKDPVVRFNTTFGEEGDGTDYGEFHPIAQLKKIMDYEVGGNFRGVDFDVYIKTEHATKMVEAIMQTKPSDRFEIDKKLMTDQEYIDNLIAFVSE
jgi:hypothetical protein